MDAEIITRQTSERNTVGKSAVDAFGILANNEPELYPRIEERLPRKKVRIIFSNFFLSPILKFFLLKLQARCHLCPRSADRKSGITCDVCHKNICSTHHSITCVKCDSEAKNHGETQVALL